MKRLILVLTLFCSTLAVAQPTTPNYLRRSGDTLITLNSFWLKAHGIKVVTAIDTTELNMERIRLSMIARGLVAASSLGSGAYGDTTRNVTLDKTQQITGRKEFSIGQEMDTVYSSVSDLAKLTLNGTSASTSFGRYLNTNSQSYVHLWGERLTSGTGTQWVAGFANAQDTVSIGHAFNIRNVPLVLSSGPSGTGGGGVNISEGYADLYFYTAPYQSADTLNFHFGLTKSQTGAAGSGFFNLWANRGISTYNKPNPSQYFNVFRVDSSLNVRFFPGIASAYMTALYPSPRFDIGPAIYDSSFNVSYGAHIGRGLKVDGASMFATPPFISTTDTLATKDYARSVGGGGSADSAVFATNYQLDSTAAAIIEMIPTPGGSVGNADSLGSLPAADYVLKSDSTTVFYTPTQALTKVNRSDSTTVFYTPTQALSKINWSDTTSSVAMQWDLDTHVQPVSRVTGLADSLDALRDSIDALRDDIGSGTLSEPLDLTDTLKMNGSVLFDDSGVPYFSVDSTIIADDVWDWVLEAGLADSLDALRDSIDALRGDIGTGGGTLSEPLDLTDTLKMNGSVLFDDSGVPYFSVDSTILAPNVLDWVLVEGIQDSLDARLRFIDTTGTWPKVVTPTWALENISGGGGSTGDTVANFYTHNIRPYAGDSLVTVDSSLNFKSKLVQNKYRDIFDASGRFLGLVDSSNIVLTSLQSALPGYGFKRSVNASQVYDCGSIAAGVDSTFNVTCTGAVAGNPAQVGVSVAAEAGLIITAECTTNDVVTVRISNHFLVAAVDPASRTYKVMVTNL